MRMGRGSTAGLGVAVLWLSLLVLLPLAAVIAKSSGAGWSGLANAFTSRVARDALFLTIGSAAAVSIVNAVMGTLVAWVLVQL